MNCSQCGVTYYVMCPLWMTHYNPPDGYQVIMHHYIHNIDGQQQLICVQCVMEMVEGIIDEIHLANRPAPAA